MSSAGPQVSCVARRSGWDAAREKDLTALIGSGSPTVSSTRASGAPRSSPARKDRASGFTAASGALLSSELGRECEPNLLFDDLDALDRLAAEASKPLDHLFDQGLGG